MAASREAEVHSDILGVFMLQAAFSRPLFIGILSMSGLEQSQVGISKLAGCEVVPFQVRAGSVTQILPQETWYRIGPAPCPRRNRIRAVRITGAPELIITGRISEHIR